MSKLNLPDPLRSSTGRTIDTVQDWRGTRRAELLELFRANVYGRAPETAYELSHETIEEDADALDGAAIRRQTAIRVTTDQGQQRIDLLLYLPTHAADQPVPVVALLNFAGNHTIHADPAIVLPRSYQLPDLLPAEAQRGTRSSRFPVEQVLARGHGIATAYYMDIVPDHSDGLAAGIPALLDPPGERPPDAWGAVGAWAWGLSRILDVLEHDAQVDHRRVTVAGHSRLGKTALWAGAQDERFAAVISNNSGCTGAAISRGKQGETVKAINDRFPHWFCGTYKQYNERESAIPVDQHELLALVAPRPLYVASASDDQWADPQAEYQACVQASPVYRLHGLDGIASPTPPPPDQPLHDGAIGYHCRTGDHDLTPYDWTCFLDFLERQLPDR